ncbi:MAG: hypothetical protein HYY13_00665 [Nitrospirae bacterium]|nr:hypothetical protein [Nitrospirota bacterium]
MVLTDWRQVAQLLERDPNLRLALDQLVKKADRELARDVAAFFVASLKTRGYDTDLSEADYMKAWDWFFVNNRNFGWGFLRLRPQPFYLRWWHRLFR